MSDSFCTGSFLSGSLQSCLFTYENVVYSDCLGREGNFFGLNATCHVTALCVCVCCSACVREWVMVIHKPTHIYIVVQHTR